MRRIDPLVDVCDICSVETQLVYRLFDADLITEALELRVEGLGDKYARIREGASRLTGRPAFYDDHEPFGSATSDLPRAMVASVTTRALVVNGSECCQSSNSMTC